MYSQDELDEHLRLLSEAWKDYMSVYHHPDLALQQMDAQARCNREIAWLYDHHLRLFCDVVWTDVVQSFVLSESIIQGQAE